MGGGGKNNYYQVPSSLFISILQAGELAYACHHQWGLATMPSGSYALFSGPNKHSGSAIIYLNLSAGMSHWKHVLAPPPAPLTRDGEGWRGRGQGTVWCRRGREMSQRDTNEEAGMLLLRRGGDKEVEEVEREVTTRWGQRKGEGLRMTAIRVWQRG